MTHFGMALSAQHGGGRNFCSWSAVVKYITTEPAHRHLIEIAEWSQIVGEFEFWG